MNKWKTALKREAVVFELGGFKPTFEPLESWFGKVSVCAPGEGWPESNGKPMHAVCQIDLRNLPIPIPRLVNIQFLTVFIGPDDLPMDSPNGENWLLRAYRNADELQPLEQQKTNSGIKPFAIKPTFVKQDYPCLDDVTIDLPSNIEDEYSEKFPNVGGLKLGGWPTLIQSEIYWAPFNLHPAQPEFVFQIDSCEKAKWQWGDGGVGYFGRGTAEGHEDEWVCSWQCF